MAYLWDWKRSKVAEAQGRLNWSSVGLNERAAGQAIRAPIYQAKPSLQDDYVTENGLCYFPQNTLFQGSESKYFRFCGSCTVTLSFL